MAQLIAQQAEKSCMISKVFISTSIMQLQEHGKLNITDPLSKYIPDFPSGNQIKLYNLLTHTSGIPEHSEPNEKISHDNLIKNYALGLYRDPTSYSDHGVLPGWNSLNSFSQNGNEFIVLLSNVQNGVKSLGAVNNQIYVMLRNKH